MTATAETTTTETTPTAETLAAAVTEYQKRQARINHPHGSFDKAGRWYPAEEESCPCCGSIRNPSRAWPLSLNKHCRSAVHVAALYHISARDLRRAIRNAA